MQSLKYVFGNSFIGIRLNII